MKDGQTVKAIDWTTIRRELICSIMPVAMRLRHQARQGPDADASLKLAVRHADCVIDFLKAEGA